MSILPSKKFMDHVNPYKVESCLQFVQRPPILLYQTM